MNEPCFQSTELHSQDAVILFADIMNSTVLSDILEAKSYHKIIQQFYHSSNTVFERVFGPFSEIKKDHIIYTTVGDEVMLLVFGDQHEGGIQTALRDVLRFARLLKINWLLSEENYRRIEVGKHPHDIGIGIDVGSVTCPNKTSYDQNQKPEGAAIILAKRLQTSAKEEGLYTRIMLSQHVFQKVIESDMRIAFTTDKVITLKGFTEKEHIFEIRYYLGYIYWDPAHPLWDKPSKYSSLFNYDCFNTWLGGEIAVAHYYRKQFYKAISVINKVLIADPSFGLAYLLRGDCYFNMAIEEKSKESKKFFFQHAIEDMSQSIQKDACEDGYIQLGLLYIAFFQHIRLKNTPKINRKDKDNYFKEALNNFYKAMMIGQASARSVFWLWVTRALKGHYDIGPHAYWAGWINKLDINKSEIEKILIERASEYKKIIMLPNYLANVHFAIGIMFSDLLENKDKAIECFESAQEIAENIKKEDMKVNDSEDDDGKEMTCIYSSTYYLMSFLQSIEEFKKGVQNAIEIVNSGQKVLKMLSPPNATI